MKAAIIPVTPFQQNCSLLVCDKTLQAAVVDPGGDIPRILEAVDRLGVSLTKILLTHGHLDHCGAAGEMRGQLGLPIEGPQREEKFWLDQLEGQCAMFGFGRVQPFEPDRWLEEGDTVSFGEQTLEVYHTPGHTPGHIIFFSRPDRLAIVGDVLFQGSVGRTDFPRGDYRTLLNSIREKLWPLGEDVAFIPGHGPVSTFGEERRSNPFCGDRVR